MSGTQPPTEKVLTGSDPAEVCWDEPEDQDPEKPTNWPPAKKWANIITISVISFHVPLASTIIAPAVPLILRHFGTTALASPMLDTFLVSVFVLGFATGPLVLAPLSELYGRVPVIHASNLLFLLFTCLCATSQTPEMLLAVRFLSGFAGSATLAIGSGTIADVMVREERGRAVSVWAVGGILGPMVGPVIGGSVVRCSGGWRWVFWVLAMVMGVVVLVGFAVLRETNHAVLLARKAVRLGNPTRKKTSPVALFASSITRPARLLLLNGKVTLMCTYVAVLYSTLYVLFATYGEVFTAYDFDPVESGLVFVPGGVGTIFGLWYVGSFSDWTLKKRAAARSGGAHLAADRLPLVITLPGTLLFPVGLFIYGWAVQFGVHWAVPLLGTLVLNFASILMFTSAQTFLIDSFEECAASVVAANTFLRGTAGALIPLVALPMYETLGWGWGNSMMAFVSLALVPIPLAFGGYGPARISRCKIQEASS